MIGWAIEAMLASALLMLAVMVLRGPVRNAFGARVAYALWALPALRMVMPPLPEGWRGEALPVLPAPEPIVIMLGKPVATLPVETTPAALGWPSIALWLWLGGAALLLAWQAVGYLRFRYNVLRLGIAVDRIGSITVVQSAATDGPLAFGVFDRVVAFPRDFAARFDPEERALALEHELGHHARGDLVANWVALAVLALHWFNPLAWAAFRKFRADQEMANDARVLARADGAARHAYGCAIVKAAHGRAVSPACHLNTVKDLKGRLKMLGKKKATRTQTATGSLAIMALALGGLAFTASGTQAAERVRAEVEDATGIEMPELPEIPQMPEMPETPEMPDVPAMPHAAPVPGTRHIVVQKHKGRDTTVTVTTDGRTTTYTGEAAERYLAAHPAPPPPAPPAPPAPNVAPVPPVPPMPPVPGVDVTELNAHAAELGRNAARLAALDAARLQRQAAQMQRHAALDSARLQRQAAAMAREAARIDTAQLRRDALETQRQALRAALTGLEQARAGLTANRNLTDAQRAEAMAAIDGQLAKLRRRVADRD
ncbi:M56 family metallopeptidase [Sphingomonas phyllosphaerae]|uniref:M56 family metallopeptidase n=1 Tax=Sphingomonas phyllosphaerae TaxID=257003 RepID=UPI0003F5A8CF|nr:M56 family metallopeptidase [Sphingomonas phyllosphaerae]